MDPIFWTLHLLFNILNVNPTSFQTLSKFAEQYPSVDNTDSLLKKHIKLCQLK